MSVYSTRGIVRFKPKSANNATAIAPVATMWNVGRETEMTRYEKQSG